MFRTWIRVIALCIAAALQPAAHAQQVSFPPLMRLIVPFSAGASNDVIARAVAAQLGPRLGTNVIVENRPGGSGLLGAAAVAQAPGDGSMLLLSSASLISGAATMKNVTFDVTTELAPVSMLGVCPIVVGVSARTTIQTPADLVGAARAKPDTITHGTAGVGTLVHIAAELMNEAAGMQLKHVPYKGASIALVDLAAGTIDVMIAVNTTMAPQIKAGRVRQIAVTSAQPRAAFPGLPAMATVAPGFSIDQWSAVFVPASMPAAMAQRLNREINAIAMSKELRELMLSDGAEPLALSPEELASRIRQSHSTWKRLAQAKGIVVE